MMSENTAITHAYLEILLAVCAETCLSLDRYDEAERNMKGVSKIREESFNAGLRVGVTIMECAINRLKIEAETEKKGEG